MQMQEHPQGPSIRLLVTFEEPKTEKGQPGQAKTASRKSVLHPVADSSKPVKTLMQELSTHSGTHQNECKSISILSKGSDRRFEVAQTLPIRACFRDMDEVIVTLGKRQ